ncbi:MAG TPA: hypothetical protein VET24_15360 [Actinomycetota bacterium]|nr:hypothetical protein [Actinomycetota bacterium]
MTMTSSTGGSRPLGPYGEYREHIRDLFASCDDVLRQIRRALYGGHPSRQYVAEKAQALRDAAAGLLRGCHDVEGCLRQCGQDVTEDWDGEPYVTECRLEAGHRGPHLAGLPASPMREATDAGRDLARAALALSDHIDWLAHRGCRLPDADDMAGLAKGLGEVGCALTGASRALECLGAVPWGPGGSAEEDRP